MGTDRFVTQIQADTPGDAFNRAVESAQWEYGHAGYTGTIAEKSGFANFGQVERRQIRKLLNALEEYRLDEMPADIQELANKARNTYMDKWGDAACFEVVGEDGSRWAWLFCGYASS